MLNVIVWICYGAIIGATIAWRRGADAAIVGMSGVVGSLGALGSGTVAAIFDATPLASFSPFCIAMATVGAVLMVALSYLLVHAAAEW